MEEIYVLDCTLRDGGYCNQWQFGFDNIKKIMRNLVESGVDIIECGFLTNKVTYDENTTLYSKLSDISDAIPRNRSGRMFVCMINFGEYTLDDIPDYDGSSVDGIRVAFHKENLLPALEFCKGIKKKGYKVFIQAMVSLAYDDGEFVHMIYLCNEFKPYAFYIVDSFGVMKQKDLMRLYYIVEHNLEESISIGYHSHNNMQLAYSNAQALVDIRTKRDIIIDSSVFGMGRGAGNLNTELFVNYLNDNVDTKYYLKPLLNIIDESLNGFYQSKFWGYSLPNYLSAMYGTHPNYSMYLDEKKTLTVEDIDRIFSIMDSNKKLHFDKDYIESLYVQYMTTGQVQEMNLSNLKEKLNGKKVLLIASGKSCYDEKDKVITFSSRNDVVSISVNFDYKECDTDFIFLSNLRRYRELDTSKRMKCIVTSNIPEIGTYLQTSYKDLRNTTEAIRDNSGMMLIKYLIKLGVKDIFLAGIDGYSTDASQNYVSRKMSFEKSKETFENINLGMSTVLRDYNKNANIEFLTAPKHVNF